MPLYHVTDPKSAARIMTQGFKGGWGDAGFGVYFYDNLDDAISYGTSGGWDHALTSFAIVEAVDLEGLAERVDPHPDWPNPEDYEAVMWVEMESSKDVWEPPRTIVYQGKARRARRR